MSGDTNFKACMLLGGVGDALAYNDGKWEFCSSGDKIQEEVRSLGGVSALTPSVRKMIVSDDTVMHIATAEAILPECQRPQEQYCTLASKYKECMRDMVGRAPGSTCVNSVKKLSPEIRSYTIPFNPRGGGCGASMRAVPIGLLYWRPEELDSLVRVAIEAGRMTHNHPTGFLGSVAVALFVSYAVQGKEVRKWGEGLLRSLHTAKQYCEQEERDWKLIRDSWGYFENQWTKYVRDTMRSDDRDVSASEYDRFVKSVSFMGTGGASGHDAPLIAYDAILRCYREKDPSSRWEKLCRYGMFHGGDSDSTGIIAGACYGAMFGLEGVPANNYRLLEYRDRLEKLGSQLYFRSLPSIRKEKGYKLSSEGLFRRERSLESLFPNRKSAGQKKRVTFKEESTDLVSGRSPLRDTRREVEHDLFSLNSMDNIRNTTRVPNISDTASISKRRSRSRSYSPPRSSEIPNAHLYSDSLERAYNLRMININNYSHFSSVIPKATKPINFQPQYNPVPYEISHSKYPSKNSDEYITQHRKSFSQLISETRLIPVSYIKQSSREKTIYYPPSYFKESPQLRCKPNISIHQPVAHSYGGTDY